MTRTIRYFLRIEIIIDLFTLFPDKKERDQYSDNKELLQLACIKCIEKSINNRVNNKSRRNYYKENGIGWLYIIVYIL